LLGPSLKTVIPFFYNTWLKYIYLPVSQHFYHVLGSNDIVDPMARFAREHQKKEAEKLSGFASLHYLFFWDATACKGLPTIVETLRKETSRQIYKQYFTGKFFAKLDELTGPENANLMKCLSVSQTAKNWDDLKSTLKELFPLGIPPKYQAGNLNLDELTNSYIKSTGSLNRKQMNERFPVEPPARRASRMMVLEFPEERERLRKDYADQMAEFRRELGLVDGEEDGEAKREELRQNADAEVARIEVEEAAELKRLTAEFEAEKAQLKKKIPGGDRVQKLVFELAAHLARESESVGKIGRAKGVAVGKAKSVEDVLDAVARGEVAAVVGALEKEWQKILNPKA
jgi:hypothetical protein